jgi:GNAT superfamily N-acetyltransferase
VLIRAAQLADAAAIATVHVDSWRTTYAGILPDDYLANLSYAQREQLWRDILSTPTGAEFVYVAEDAGGNVIGFAAGGAERSGDAVYRGELYAMYLRDRYHRRGIGRHLTMAVVNRLLHEGASSMLVWVLAANPSRAFYEALGGQQVSEKSVTIGGVPCVEVAYGWLDLRGLATQATQMEL